MVGLEPCDFRSEDVGWMREFAGAGRERERERDGDGELENVVELGRFRGVMGWMIFLNSCCGQYTLDDVFRGWAERIALSCRYLEEAR